MEFQTEAWQAAYVRRIDATIAALKSANVPVFWVGLPPQRDAAPAADAVYLNELYRTRAERAGIVYVDIWDGFVDEAGRYVLQGPDFEGQIRRLRSGDGVYFTRAGARKLAHYVEREILRSLLSRADAGRVAGAGAGGAAARRAGRARVRSPGPVVPLTAVDRRRQRAARRRPGAARPGTIRWRPACWCSGEPITAPAGRADNFAWPRGGVATIREGEPDDRARRRNRRRRRSRPRRPPAAQQPPAAAAAAAARPPVAQQPRRASNRRQQQPAAAAAPKQQPRRSAEPRQPPRADNDGMPRPPLRDRRNSR